MKGSPQLMPDRLSLQFTDNTVPTLRSIADRNGTNLTEQVRRAVRLLAWFESLHPHEQVQIAHRNGTITRVKVL